MDKKRILTVLLTLTGLECLVGVFLLLAAPASESHQILYTFSLPQIIFSLIWLLFASACFYYAWSNDSHAKAIFTRFFAWIEDTKITNILLLAAAQILLIAVISISFNSPNIWGGFTGYLIRLRPFVGWVILVVMQFIVAMVLVKNEWTGKKPGMSRPSQAVLFVFVLGIFCLMWILIGFTGYGVGTNGDPIRTPTIFITYPELFAALLITAQVWLVNQFGKLFLSQNQQINLARVSTLLIAVIIWMAAVLIWSNEPMRSSYYRIGPFPPNGDYVPASDPTRFDLPGQMAIIGQGLNNGDYIDNPFYVFAVMIFRVIGGQYYDRMIFYQILVLGLNPCYLFPDWENLPKPIPGHPFSGVNHTSREEYHFLLGRYVDVTRQGIAHRTIYHAAAGRILPFYDQMA